MIKIFCFAISLIFIVVPNFVAPSSSYATLMPGGSPTGLGGAHNKMKLLLQKNHDISKLIEAQIIAKNYEKLQKKSVIAFCGLAYPEKFFGFLSKLGFELVDAIEFSDHHDYTDEELQDFLQISEEKDAILLTTKKDWVKFKGKYKKKINFLEIELEIEDFIDEIF